MRFRWLMVVWLFSLASSRVSASTIDEAGGFYLPPQDVGAITAGAPTSEQSSVVIHVRPLAVGGSSDSSSALGRLPPVDFARHQGGVFLPVDADPRHLAAFVRGLKNGGWTCTITWPIFCSKAS